MPKFSVNQKKPNMKQKNKETAPHLHTPRKELHPVSVPTLEGDLGVIRMRPSDIPKMSKAPTSTGDSLKHHVVKVGDVMKRAGMLV